MENFKLVSSKKEISFEKNALNILDGPNGYGKTSIFDAIEILINGQRYREEILDTSSNIQVKPLTFANDSSKPVTLTGVFENNNESITVKRLFEKSDRDGRSNKVKDASKLFVKSAENGYVTITEEDFHKKIGLTKSGKDFNMLYYIQQEESTSFLKKKEKDRIEELSYLFNMSSEQENKKKIANVKKRIKTKKQELTTQSTQLHDKLATYTKLTDKTEKPTYQSIFKNSSILWDQENPVLDKESFEFALTEIDKFEQFLLNKDNFLIERVNRELDAVASNSLGILNLVLIPNEIYEKRMELLSRQSFQKWIINGIKAIESENIMTFLEKSRRDFIERFDFDREEFKRLSIEIAADKLTLNKQQELLANLSSLREKLWDEFQRNVNHKTINNSEQCPMCGYDYQEKEILIRHVKQTKDNLQEIMGSALVATKDKQIKLDKLASNFKNQLVEQKKSYVLNDSLVNNLQKYDKLTDRIERAKAYFSDNNIDYQSLQVSETTTEEDYYERVSQLIAQINERKQINQVDITDVYNSWVTILKRYFDNDSSKLPTISKESFNNKRQYLTYFYFTSSEREYNIVYAEFEKKEKQIEKLDGILNKIEDVEKVYIEKIKVYQTTMINLLQIPLFIFSGKLLQNYPGGLGIFIEIDSQGKYLKLLTDPKQTTIDGISKLSTGQLSSLVITLVLAMNKIFSKNQLNTIFIDDPVQSMDEINVNAFIDIMRHEFKGHQIILSTHEEKISMFFEYKYQMSNLPSHNFNVQKNFLAR